MNKVYDPARRQTAYVDSAGKKKLGTTDWDRQKRSYEREYLAQRDDNARALAAAQQQARETADAQIEALNREYRGTNRQLYRDYMQRQRTLPQQLAARGWTGGLTESARLRLGNAYEEALNTNEQARIGRETDYNRDLSRQLYEAQAAADAADSRARQDYYSRLDRLGERKRSALEQRAATLAAQGDFRLYKKLGYTDSEIKYLMKMFRRRNPKLF